jgi:hypothetical protein
MHNVAFRTGNNREAGLFTCEHALFYVLSRHLLDIERNCKQIALARHSWVPNFHVGVIAEVVAAASCSPVF